MKQLKAGPAGKTMRGQLTPQAKLEFSEWFEQRKYELNVGYEKARLIYFAGYRNALSLKERPNDTKG